jgi:hypothetical protein
MKKKGLPIFGLGEQKAGPLKYEGIQTNKPLVHKQF